MPEKEIHEILGRIDERLLALQKTVELEFALDEKHHEAINLRCQDHAQRLGELENLRSFIKGGLILFFSLSTVTLTVLGIVLSKI